MRLHPAHMCARVKTSQLERQMGTKIYKSVQLSKDVCHFENHEQEKEREKCRSKLRTVDQKQRKISSIKEYTNHRTFKAKMISGTGHIWSVSYIIDYSWGDFSCSKLYTNWYLYVGACTNYEEFRGNSQICSNTNKDSDIIHSYTH